MVMLERHKKSVFAVLIVLVGINFSLLSSYVIQNFGCGLLGDFGLVSCGYYAGFPVPFVRYIAVSNQDSQQKIINPTSYVKYKYSPVPEMKQVAKRMEESGNIASFYLSNPQEWDFYLLNFILNSVMWLAPIVFLILVFN